MNPNAPQPSFELPTPLVPGEGQPQGVPEKPLPGPELAPQAPAAQMSSPSTPQAQPMMPTSHPVSAVPLPPTPTATPTIADDTDLIEKEWVQKAKQIVAATKDDPYTQNRELSKFKADYLKKRYNKDIKVEES